MMIAKTPALTFRFSRQALNILMHRYWVASFVLSVDRQAAADIQEQFGTENCNFVVLRDLNFAENTPADFQLMTLKALLV